MTDIAVTVAGSDSSGGAGIQADLKTFSALGVYGASVITALTAQNTQGVQGIHAVPAGFVGQQIDSVYGDLKVDATKIGMLADPSVIAAVRDGLDRHAIRKVVLDPVMVAASGDPLIQPEAISAIAELLVPRATIITPNLPEAATLLNAEPAEDEAAMKAQAQALIAMGARAVMLKGGHGTGRESVDLFMDKETCFRLVAPRTKTRNTHGTGCTLSSAIAANLAKGKSLDDAVRLGKDYVTAAIAAADTLAIGAGHGPVHHFYASW
ncbi:MAG: bifunctional hydroxymethylpyrimidine kinase/phosphomethylpyrimidine kinase [Rhodobiaceae bacterium]|nr:bifunctional hydroxymethylpyrimidine kinase/phosphomethylpyrimidine kinase [Rhodobiaceae bacterium]